MSGQYDNSAIAKSLSEARRLQDLIKPAQGGRTCALCGLDYHGDNIVIGALACVCEDCCSSAFAVYHQWTVNPELSYKDAFNLASARVRLASVLDPAHQEKYKKQQVYNKEQSNG